MMSGPGKGQGGRLLGRIRGAIESGGLIRPGGTVLVACSGGVDSMSLLDLLHRIGPRFRFEVAACHLDHGLRGREGGRDQGLVASFCAGRGIPFRGGAVDVAGIAARKGLCRQEAAREARYAFFRECLREMAADRLATAHHADDQVETVLLRMLRGSGPRGLRGIPLCREGVFIRPMLEVGKAEIRSYAERRGIPFREDPGNLHLAYARNRVRHEILPLLETAWPGARTSLLRLARWLTEEGEAVDALIARTYEDLLRRRLAGEIVLDRRGLLSLSPYLVKQAIRRGTLDLGAGHGPSSVHLEAALGFVRTAGSGRRIDLPGGIVLGRDGGEIFLLRGRGPAEAPRAVGRRIEIEDGWKGAFRIGEQTVRVRVDLIAGRGGLDPRGGGRRQIFDLREIVPPLRIRPWRAGDRMVPFGMSGRKRVSDLLRERGVVRRRRADVPVIEDARSILWVVGVRRSARGRVTPACLEALSIRAEDGDGMEA